MSIENNPKNNITTEAIKNTSLENVYIKNLNKLLKLPILAPKNIYHFIKKIEYQLYNWQTDIGNIVDLFTYIVQLKKTYSANHLQKLLFIWLQILISNYLIEQWFEELVIKWEEQEQWAYGIFSLTEFNIENFFNKFNNSSYNFDKENKEYLYKLKFLLANYSQVFKYKFLYFDLKKHKDINILTNNTFLLLERNLALLKQLHNSLKLRLSKKNDYIPTIDFIKIISTTISFSNYYFILSEFSQKNLPIEIAHKKKYYEILNEYPILCIDIYKTIFKTISQNNKNFLKEIPFRTLIVILWNLKLLQNLQDKNDSEIEKIILEIVNTINDNFYDILKENLEKDGLETRFLNFYSGFQFEIDNETHRFNLKEFIYPSLRKLVKYDLLKNKQDLRNTLSFLKHCPFNNLKIFSTICAFILPDKILKEALLEDDNFSTIEYIDYIENISWKYENLIQTHLPGHSIEYYKTFLELVLWIDIKSIHIYTHFNTNNLNFLKPSNIINFSSINKFKYNYFPLSRNIWIYIDDITKKIFIYNLHKNFIIEINCKFIDKDFSEKKKKIFQTKIIHLTNIMIDKISSYFADLEKLDKILTEMVANHPETIYHMEIMWEIIDLFFEKKEICKYISNEINYLTSWFFITQKELAKFLAYFHDIGKSYIDKELTILSKINRITHIEIFNYILNSLLSEDLFYTTTKSTKITENAEIDFSKLTKNFKIFIKKNFSKDIKETKREILNLDIYLEISKKLFNKCLDIYKKNRQLIANFFNNNKINDLSLFHKGIYDILTRKLQLSKTDIDFFFFFFYSFMDILIYERIKDIQTPHVTKWRDILKESSLQPFYRCTEHHKYPPIDKDYTFYFQKIAEYFSKFKDLIPYWKIINKKNLLVKTSMANWPIYRDFKEKDPLTTIIIISDIISALSLSNRSYIKHLQNIDNLPLAIKQFILNGNFLNLIEKEIKLANSTISQQQLFNILDSDLKDNKFRENIKTHILAFLKNELKNVAQKSTKIKFKITTIKNKLEIKETLELPNVYIIIPPQKSIPAIKKDWEFYITLRSWKRIKLPIDVIPYNVNLVEKPSSIKNTSNETIIIWPDWKFHKYIESNSLFKNPIILTYPPDIPITIDYNQNWAEIILLEDNVKNYRLQYIPWKVNYNLLIPEEIKIDNCYFEWFEENSINIRGSHIKDSTIRNFKSITISCISSGNYIQWESININKISSSTNNPNLIKWKNIKIKNVNWKSIIIGQDIEINELNTPSIIISFWKVKLNKVLNNCYIICKNKSDLSLPKCEAYIGIYESNPDFYVKNFKHTPSLEEFNKLKREIELNSSY